MKSHTEVSDLEGPELEFGLTNKRYFYLILVMGMILILTGILFLRLEFTVTSQGRVYAAQEWYVYAPEEEVIVNVLGRIGEPISQGDPLFQFDTSDLDLEIVRRREALLRTEDELQTLHWEIKLAEIRPSQPELLSASEQASILSEIKSIQSAMTESLENLSDQRAIRSLEFHRQRIENLRTNIDSLTIQTWLNLQEKGLWDLEQSKLKARQVQLQSIADNLREEINLLEKRRERLQVTAPINGDIVEIYYRHVGMRPAKGDRLAKIAVPDNGYRVRAYMNERNYDLVKPGMPVRMESEVFNSTLEGYVKGTVYRVGRDSNQTYSSQEEGPRYEVWIEVDESPYPLVLGSTLKVDVLMGKVSILETFLRRPENRRNLKASNQESTEP